MKNINQYIKIEIHIVWMCIYLVHYNTAMEARNLNEKICRDQINDLHEQLDKELRETKQRYDNEMDMIRKKYAEMIRNAQEVYNMKTK